MRSHKTLDRQSRVRVIVIAVAASLVLAGNVAFAAPGGLAPAVVHVRVEGATSTIVEGFVFTNGHTVTTASGGSQMCDGTNNGVNPTPGPSATAALDDDAEFGGFDWDGTFSAGFDDYFITRIGPDTQTATAFWGILLNDQFTSVGGYQQRVGPGDEVLFAYDAFFEVTCPAPGRTRPGQSWRSHHRHRNGRAHPNCWRDRSRCRHGI